MRGFGRLAAVILFGVAAAMAVNRHWYRPLLPANLHYYFVERLGRQLGEFWRPGAGLWVLPESSQEAIAMLRGRGVTQYRLSPGFRSDQEGYQRLEEGAWPIRPEDGAPWAAPWYVAKAGEALPPGCELTEARAAAILARCP
jgi:hypothetical protein